MFTGNVLPVQRHLNTLGWFWKHFGRIQKNQIQTTTIHSQPG